MLGIVLIRVPPNSFILYNGRGASDAHMHLYVMLVIPVILAIGGFMMRRPSNGTIPDTQRTNAKWIVISVTLSFLAAQALGMYAFLTASFS